MLSSAKTLADFQARQHKEKDRPEASFGDDVKLLTEMQLGFIRRKEDRRLLADTMPSYLPRCRCVSQREKKIRVVYQDGVDTCQDVVWYHKEKS